MKAINFQEFNEQVSQHGLIIENGGVVIQSNIFLEDLVISPEGKILPYKTSLGSKAATIDARGKVILPGAVDVHVHTRDGAQAYKEDWESFSRAALAGGVTSALGMPNVNPLTDTTEKLRDRLKLAKKSLINYGEYIGSLGNNAEEIASNEVQQKAAGIKLYLNETTGGFTVSEKEALEIAGQTAGKNQLIFVLHAEGNTLRKVAPQLLQLGHRVHVAHISLAEEVSLVKEWSERGYPITAEVTPHHLLIGIESVRQKVREDLCDLCVMKPPLSPEKDLPALIAGLREEYIRAIATDHAPHTEEEKRQALAEGKKIYGVTGVQEMLPLMITHLPKYGFNLPDIARLTATNPSRLFGLKGRGRIEQGYQGDLTIVDHVKSYRLGDHHHPLYSRAGWSIYQDWPVHGEITATLVNGKLAYANNQFSRPSHSNALEFER